MNAGELKTAVRRRTGVDYADAALLEVVNEGLQAVAAEADWPWLQHSRTFDLADGQGSYALPDDHLRTRAILAGTTTLEALDYGTLRDLDAYEGSRGYPGWTITGDSILVRPVPTSVSTLTHHYLRTEPELVLDADEPLLPRTFHGAIVAYASRLVFERTDEPRRQEAAERDWLSWLKRLQNERRRYTGPTLPRVRSWG